VTLIRKLWYILSPRERIEGSMLLCGKALGALFEAVSIGLVVPFIAVLKDPGLVLNAPVTQPLVSALNIREPQMLLVILGLGLVGAFVIKSGYLLLLNRWLFRYVFKKHVRLARQLLTGYLKAPYTFHLHGNSAEMIKVMTGTIQGFTSGFLVNLLTLLGEVLVVVALIILLMLIEPLTTLGAVFVLGVPTALSYRLMRRRLAMSGRLSQESFTSVVQWTEQAIGGIKETLVTGRVPFFIERQGDHVRRLADSVRSFAFLSTIPRLVVDTLGVTAMVMAALVIFMRGKDMQSLLPVFGMFAVAAMRLMPSMSRIGGGLAQLRFLCATTEVLYDELCVLERDELQRVSPATAWNPCSPLPFERSLVVEHLSYRYPSMPQRAIDDVSLEIPRGHWVGLIGPTGAGKTTLVDLMLGLLVPTSGRILVDGRDLQHDVTRWQRNIGLVPQNVYLMDDTLRRNVAFGLPDHDIDDERLWEALRAARIDNFVHSLPSGLNALIGERGDRLSGGERQRLGIARALYRDPQVLVIDEGTANLDNETEAAIVRTLSGLRGKKTIIVVAHRLPLVRTCDSVCLLRQGRVQNFGAYSDLFSTDRAFREFAGSPP
jgi:ATP-binding cassette subfamily C protein